MNNTFQTSSQKKTELDARMLTAVNKMKCLIARLPEVLTSSELTTVNKSRKFTKV
jgi:hypothetical protein